MSTTLSTRKPLRQLTRADLQAFPVWEWAVNEDGAECHDQSIVRPTTHAELPVDMPAHFIVAANADLRDGSSLPALVEVTIKGKRRRFEPLGVLLFDRHLDFVGPEVTRVLSHYTKTADNYPVRWQLTVPVAGEHALRGAKVKQRTGSGILALLWRPRVQKRALGVFPS